MLDGNNLQAPGSDQIPIWFPIYPLNFFFKMSIRILVIGNGGREHALAWKLSQSPLVEKIFVCPGNGGTSQEPKTINVNLPANDLPKLVEFAVQNNVRLRRILYYVL